MAHARRRWLLQQGQYPIAESRVVRRRFSGARSVAKAAHAILRKAPPPLADRWNRCPDLTRYLLNFLSLEASQHNTGALNHPRLLTTTSTHCGQLSTNVC